MREKLLEALQFRHACKIFDAKKKISDKDFAYILEAGRLSPSSFGMEHWRFLVVEDKKIRESLKPLCWGQEQITTCSKLVIVKAQKALVKKDTQYVKDMFLRRGLSPAHTEAYIKKYGKYIKWRKTYESLASWSGRQCYIAAANMMTAAAFIGIDSCPLEGFEKEKLEAYLKIDTKKEDVALILAFGYRLNPQPKKLRLPVDALVQTL